MTSPVKNTDYTHHMQLGKMSRITFVSYGDHPYLIGL